MTSPSPRALLTTASLGIALAAADTYVVVLALTDMMTGVGVGIDALQRATPIISGFLLGYVAVLPLIGRLSDLLSRKAVLLGCFAVFTVGSGITALATDLPVLVGGRVIQGVGGGGMVPATLALVGALWPADRRGMPLGVVGAVQELGSVLGPVLGALVLAVADWRAIFWVNAVAGVLLYLAVRVIGGPSGKPARPWVVALAGVALAVGALTLAAPEVLTRSVALGAPFVPLGDSTAVLATPIGLVTIVLALGTAGVVIWRQREVLRRADLLGALLLGGALACVVVTFASSDPEREVVGPLGLALLPVGALLLGLYAAHHRRSAAPLVPRGLVRGRALTALVVSFLVGVALVSVVVDVPLLARLTYTTEQTEAALVLVRFLVAVPGGALLGGFLLRFTGDGTVSAIGLFGAGAGLLIMTGWGRGALATTSSTLVLVLVGLGVGLALAPVNNATLAATPAEHHGTASALVVVARMVGMVVGLALLTSIGLHAFHQEVDRITDIGNTGALVDAALTPVHWVFRGAAVSAFAGALISLRLGVRRDHETASAARHTVGL